MLTMINKSYFGIGFTQVMDSKLIADLVEIGDKDWDFNGNNGLDFLFWEADGMTDKDGNNLYESNLAWAINRVREGLREASAFVMRRKNKGGLVK